MDEVVTWRKDSLGEAKKQLWLAGPLFLVGLAQYGVLLISLVFVGHVGQLALSGASMAYSFGSVIGYSLLQGMASALDTLSGQSYGANKPDMLGIQMQRAMIVLSIASIFLAVIWANTRIILTALHQDPEIAKAAGVYARVMIPSLFPFALLQCIVKFLQNQNTVTPMMLLSGIATALHAPVCWALVYKSSLGYKGAAVANSVTYTLNVLFFALYIKFSPSCKESWTGFSMEAFQKIYTFLKLAIPSALMHCLKVWSFELAVLLAGLLPNPKVEASVQSICLNTFSLVWMIAFGLGEAVSTRVSNSLGAGLPKTARLAASVSLFMAFTEGIAITLVMILVRNVWGHVYSSDQEVIRGVADTMTVLACASFLDSHQSVLSGIARGCGWQKFGAIINLLSFYLVGIPIGVVLAFIAHLNGKGLWLGIGCALFVQVLGLLVMTLHSNWDEEAKKADKRVNGSSIPERIEA